MLAEVAGEAEDGEEPMILPPPPEHVQYDLNAMVEAISSVGYDGTLSIDFRGDDVTLGIRQSCEALTDALDRLAGA